MSKVQLSIPAKLIDVFKGECRYRGAYGGRGSAKTRTFALMTAVWAYKRDMAGDSGVILCAREFMNSLEESSLEEVKQAIRSTEWLLPHFIIGEKFIKTRSGRISYVFAGLRHNLDSIKSKARILLAWVEEAETVSEMAWQKLEPTVREHQSEIWVTWNPEKRGSATDERYRQHKPENSKIVEMNYHDNPWFPAELEQTRLADKQRLDDATYRWIWQGDYLEQSEAQIFRDKFKELMFTPQSDFNGPYYGLDFGFANDPTAAVKCWVFNNDLYIEYEAGKVRLELDETAEFITQRIPEFAQHKVRADSARPESISYLRRHGVSQIEGVKKWQGSVEDGIEHIKSYNKVYIHPRCKETVNEFRLYSYKTDRLSGDVLPQIIDANNHYIDALRYALTPLIKKRGDFKQTSLKLY